jgi:hypothetical protein
MQLPKIDNELSASHHQPQTDLKPAYGLVSDENIQYVFHE